MQVLCRKLPFRAPGTRTYSDCYQHRNSGAGRRRFGYGKEKKCLWSISTVTSVFSHTCKSEQEFQRPLTQLLWKRRVQLCVTLNLDNHFSGRTWPVFEILPASVCNLHATHLRHSNALSTWCSLHELLGASLARLLRDRHPAAVAVSKHSKLRMLNICRANTVGVRAQYSQGERCWLAICSASTVGSARAQHLQGKRCRRDLRGERSWRANICRANAVGVRAPHLRGECNWRALKVKSE